MASVRFSRLLTMALGFAGALLFTPPNAGADVFVVPEITVRVVEPGGGRAVADVEVELFVDAKRGGDRALGRATTGADGRVRFEPARVDKLKRIALRLTWKEAGRPRRGLVYELKTKKGDKIDGGRRVRPGKDSASYLVQDETRGDCDNLFTVAERGGGLEIVFERPETYAQCEGTHVKFPDMGAIGQRKLNAGTLNLYSFEQDVSMGRQFADEMGPQQPVLDDPLVTRYVENLVARLGRASDLPDLEYHVQVIDADVLNAFALPGGYVWVYRGLIEETEHESELVGVLAHELAHVTSRHGTEGVTSAMSKMMGAMILGGVVAGEVSDDDSVRQMIMQAVMTGTSLWVLGGGRKREAEADRLGAQYAQRAGYDPRGLATFFGKLSANRDHAPRRLETLFADHPSDANRIRNVGEMVDYFLPHQDGLVTSSPEYEAVKKRLADLPPAKMGGETAANALFSSFKQMNEDFIWEQFEAYVATGESDDEESEEP